MKCFFCRRNVGGGNVFEHIEQCADIFRIIAVVHPEFRRRSDSFFKFLCQANPSFKNIIYHFSAVRGPTPSISSRMRFQETTSRGFSSTRKYATTSFTCAVSINLNPPNLRMEYLLCQLNFPDQMNEKMSGTKRLFLPVEHPSRGIQESFVQRSVTADSPFAQKQAVVKFRQIYL